ncbi:MAG: hypothetical protein LBB41_03030 [Prevotellaceae bacterium]|jgi:5-hydroxyisourate hydrolase-like protein (transthyretin family)|nr:hypothetical protein [Prevotellaceae bacterium]
MKRVILLSFILISIVMNAQTFDYQAHWKEIETAQQKGEVKSLLPKVDAIFQQAKREGNTAEIVNSLIYKEQILAQTQEDADNDSWKMVIVDFEAQIPQLEGVTKAILQSLLAKIYENYANSTQWKRQSITETENPPADIAEWTTARLMRKSFDLHYSSVTDYKETLLKTKTEDFKKILTSTEDIELYPTMLDVLSYRFYDFLSNENYRIYIAETADIHKNFNLFNFENIKKDLIEYLIDFHKNDKNKSAFLNYKLAEIENKKIENETDKAKFILLLADYYKAEPFSAYLYYTTAEIYRNNGDNKRAHEICKSVIYNESNKWTQNAKSLIAQLEQQNLQISIDENNLPATAIAVSITTTNCDKVFYRIYKATQNQGKYNSLENKKGSTLVKSGFWNLKKFDDFAQHSTIAKLDGIQEGFYCIEIANNQNFEQQKKGKTTMKEAMFFAVHNLAVADLGNNRMQILNRKTGEPIKNQRFDIYRMPSNGVVEKSTIKTNEQGIFILNNSKSYSSDFNLYDLKSKVYISLGNNFYEENNYTQPYYSDIFLDRAIYRPSQTVYFKAILYKKDKNKAEIVKNQQITVELENMNREKVSDLQLFTNDYGSVFGEFILPKNGLTGTYSIKVNFSQKTFRVEDYKRPKFEVVMDSLKGEFTLEKEVKTTGKAVSYAGANISDAKVVYHVERQEIFPYIPFWRMIYPPQPTNNETITRSETTTDSDGKFEISFTAKPANDKTSSKYRTYIYNVFADVTDING